MNSEGSKTRFIHDSLLWVAITLVGALSSIIFYGISNRVENLEIIRDASLQRLSTDEVEITSLKTTLQESKNDRKELRDRGEDLDHRITIVETWMRNIEKK